MCVEIFNSENKVVKSVQDIKEKYIRELAAKNVYQTDETITFKFGRDGFLDPGSVYILFTVWVNANTTGMQAIPGSGVSPTGLNFTFTQGISNVFSRVRLLFGNTGIVEDIQEYGLLKSLFSLVEITFQDMVSTDNLIEGNSLKIGSSGSSIQNTALDRRNYHNVGNNTTTIGLGNAGRIARRYKMKLELGLLNQKRPLPLFLLNDELIVELTVNKLYNCAFFADCPVVGIPSVTETPIKIGLPEMVYVVKLPSGIERVLAEKALLSRMSLTYTTFTYINKKIDPFSATQNLTIPLFNKRILYAIAVIRCENDRNRNVFCQDPNNLYCSLDPRTGRTNAAGGGVAFTHYGARDTALRSYQWFYNNSPIPEKEISVINNDSFVSTLTYFPTPDQKTGTAPEAIHYLKETLNMRDKSFGLSQNDIFGFYDAYNNPGITPSYYNNISNTATNTTGTALPYQQFRTVTSSFMIAGKFYSQRDSGVLYALDGNSLSATLTLKLNFNQAFTVSSDFSTPPPMSVDIFLACDGNVSIDRDKTISIDL
jgi:hypothetical protein